MHTVPPPLPLALLIAPDCDHAQAARLVKWLRLPQVDSAQAAVLVLRLDPERLSLCKPGDAELPGSLWVDFSGPKARHRLSHAGQELLVRAARVRHTESPLVIDAAAGLGRDGFLLAAAGFRVRMCERNPVIAALLNDGLRRAAATPALAAIARRITLIAGDALEALGRPEEPPDVIYLDPMFPERNKSAKVKQELRLLQLIEDGRDDGEALLRAALLAGARKVVVKRPLKGPLLGNLSPAYALRGKAVRFDVYVGPPKGLAKE